MTRCGGAGARGPAATLRRTFAGARAALLVAAAALAAGCASVPALAPAPPGETLSGRLAMRVEAHGNESARAFSAAFDLRGDPVAGELGLSTPLGSMLAQARWRGDEAVLVTPRGSRSFADLDQLTREALGESLPIAAWFDWLRGRPWPGAPSTPLAGAGAGFAQLGWTVDLERLGTGAVVATRERPAPTVRVRIQVDPS